MSRNSSLTLSYQSFSLALDVNGFVRKLLPASDRSIADGRDTIVVLTATCYGKSCVRQNPTGAVCWLGKLTEPLPLAVFVDIPVQTTGGLRLGVSCRM
jgi:hypothetical protein